MKRTNIHFGGVTYRPKRKGDHYYYGSNYEQRSISPFNDLRLLKGL